MVDNKNPGANRFTEQFGSPKDRSVDKVVNTMSDVVQEFIRQSPFCILATSDSDGNCDASPKGGKKGFVTVLDDRHIIVPDTAGNKLFQTYLNMDTNPHVGIVFLIPGSNDTVRVNGSVSILEKADLDKLNVELSVNYHDDNTSNLQGIMVEVEEAFTHCPRAFKFADLWNEDEISRHQQEIKKAR